jgi:cephalosporin hydroxylase
MLDDLNADSRKLAEDIIKQTRLGFREEATKRIVSILDSHHQLQNEIVELKKQKEEERLSAARDRIQI